jgi:hypothetical protein
MAVNNDENGGEDDDDDDSDDVNAIRKGPKGKPNNSKSQNRGPTRTFNSSQAASSGNGPIRCYYCNKMGHPQSKCNKRIAEKGQWKDKHGKPWVPQNKRVSEVDERSAETVDSIDFGDSVPYYYSKNSI